MKIKPLLAALSIAAPGVAFGVVHATSKPVKPNPEPVVQQISVQPKKEPVKKVEQVKTQPISTTAIPAAPVKPKLERTKMPTKLPDPTLDAILPELVTLKNYNGELFIMHEAYYGIINGTNNGDRLDFSGSVMGDEYNLIGTSDNYTYSNNAPCEVRKIDRTTYTKLGTVDWITQDGFRPRHKEIIEFIEKNLDDNYTISRFDDAKQTSFNWNLTDQLAHQLLKILDIDFSKHAQGFTSETNVDSYVYMYWQEDILGVTPTLGVNLDFRSADWTKGVHFFNQTSFQYDIFSDLIQPLVAPAKQ